MNRDAQHICEISNETFHAAVRMDLWRSLGRCSFRVFDCVCVCVCFNGSLFLHSYSIQLSRLFVWLEEKAKRSCFNCGRMTLRQETLSLWIVVILIAIVRTLLNSPKRNGILNAVRILVVAIRMVAPDSGATI